MRKVLKWIGIVLVVLIAGIVLINVSAYFGSNARINKSYEIDPEAVAIRTDEETLAQGEHISIIFGCTDCHGANLAGEPVIDDPAIGRIYATNLTGGAGGINDYYNDVDYVRAIRHGVGADGKPLFIMPSEEYYYLSNTDLGALIAYLKTVAPVDNETPEPSLGPMGRILILAGVLPAFSAEEIDHVGARPVAPEPGVTEEYGRYLAVGCVGCHGQNYTGGSAPGSPPDAPLAPNLTPGGELVGWTIDDFIQTLRTGVTPGGHELDESAMPWPNIGQMTDDELTALFLFLQSLAAVQN